MTHLDSYGQKVKTSAADTSSTSMQQAKVNILGAGIAGLSLASHLRARKVPYQIFDRTSKPRGHTYGLSLHAQALDDLPFQIGSKQAHAQFQTSVAVDRLIGGNRRLPPPLSSSPSHARTTTNVEESPALRAQDAALRAFLAQDAQNVVPIKLTNVETTPDGIQLNFENGTSTTAAVTVDASGEQSPLISQLLPDLKPEVLPYAVYHGSRYLRIDDFNERYPDLFEHATHVRELSLPSLTNPSSSSSSAPEEATHIQVSRSYITFTDLPSAIQHENQDHNCHQRQNVNDKDNNNNNNNNNDADNLWVEVRYTLSRPVQQRQPDSLFKPNRTRGEAKTIPAEFYDDLGRTLETHADSVPRAVSKFLAVDLVKRDRVLNWLMRACCLDRGDLKALADRGVLVIGDAAHALPILGSEGACLALSDAKSLAAWLDEYLKHRHSPSTRDLHGFYEAEGMLEKWKVAEVRSRERLRKTHTLTEGGS